MVVQPASNFDFDRFPFFYCDQLADYSKLDRQVDSIINWVLALQGGVTGITVSYKGAGGLGKGSRFLHYSTVILVGYSTLYAVDLEIRWIIVVFEFAAPSGCTI